MDDKLNPKDAGKVAFFGTLGVIGVFIFMYWLWCCHWDYYREHGILTKAVVRTDIYYPHPARYIYYVGSIEYVTQIGYRNRRCHFNHLDTITILYDPEDPQDSYPACELLDEYMIESKKF